MALRPKQRRFVEEYLVDLNATQAALRAGYSPHTVNQQGPRLLVNVGIQAAIQAAMAARSAQTGITADQVLHELARLAFVDPRKLYDAHGHLKPISALDDDTAAAIAGLDVLEAWEGPGEARMVAGQTKKLRLWNKPEALKLLGQHLRLFAEVVEQKTAIEVTLVDRTREANARIMRLRRERAG
jgi:phage terminase small subunit